MLCPSECQHFHALCCLARLFVSCNVGARDTRSAATLFATAIGAVVASHDERNVAWRLAPTSRTGLGAALMFDDDVDMRRRRMHGVVSGASRRQCALATRRLATSFDALRVASYAASRARADRMRAIVARRCALHAWRQALALSVAGRAADDETATQSDTNDSSSDERATRRRIIAACVALRAEACAAAVAAALNDSLA